MDKPTVTCPKRNFKLYLTLFLTIFKFSSFTFGGGFVIVSLMKKKFVTKLGWINEKEMLDYTAIAQTAPGSISINSALLVGYQIGGILGALVTVTATILPPLIVLSVISVFYKQFCASAAARCLMKSMQAGAAAVIADVVCGMAVSIWHDSRWLAVIIAAAAFFFTSIFRINIFIIVGAAGLCGALFLRQKKRTVTKTDDQADPSQQTLK